MVYEHIQFGYTGILTTALLIAIGSASLPAMFEDELWIGVLMVVFIVDIAVLTFWFSKLSVVVNSQQIVVTFGLGKPHRAIDLSDVVGVQQVRNTWIHGLGVRKVSRGWMYNVWGLDAVELELSSGQVFRIGTNDADRLHAAISLSPKSSY